MSEAAFLDPADLKTVLDGITSRLLESVDPEALYDAVVHIAMETTGAQASSLYLEQQETKGEAIVMVAGAGYEVHRIGRVYRRGQGLTGWIWDTSSSVKYDNREEVENRKGPWLGVHNDVVRKRVPNWQCWSLIGVPLRIGNRTIGVLKVENRNPNPPACFTRRDQTVLEIIASTMAVAIENRRRMETAYTDILSALHEVSDMLVSKEILPFSALCHRIVSKCVEIFNAEACSLYLPAVGATNSSAEEETITMVAGAGYEVHRIGKAAYRKGQGLTGSIWQDGKPVKYDSREALETSGKWQGVHNDLILSKVPTWVCSSLIGVPLRIGTRTIGVIKVENRKAPKSHFSYEELRSLEILAGNIALALEMLDRHRRIFWQGERARELAHGLGDLVGVALVDVRECVRLLDGLPGSREKEQALKYLELVRTKLTETHRQVDAKYRIQDLVNELLTRTQGILNERKILAHVDVPPEPIYVNVNWDQMLQACGSLVSNAIDALAGCQDPQLWILAILGAEERQPRELELTIRDNGPGLDSDQRDRFRVTGQLASTKHPGLGTGVAQAYRYCAENGAFLALLVPRTDSSGVEFRITFTTCSPARLRLLVIDDRVIDDFKRRVDDHGGIDATYRTGPEDLTAVLAGGSTESLAQYDAILLDCNFEAGVEGHTVYRQLLRAAPDIARKVTLMSSYPRYFQLPDITVHKKLEILD
jgi:GAF domain-containing protein